MYPIRTWLLTFTSAVVLSFCAQAQSEITSFGGTIYDAGGNISYSVGQVAYTHIAVAGWQWNEGVQHAHDFIILSAPNQNYNTITVFPNPSNGIFQLQQASNEALRLMVHDIHGKQVWHSKINDFSTQIDLAFLSSGIYFLTCQQGNSPSQVFKLVRTN